MNDDTVEQWRDIPGFEDRYEVSDHGRVRSKNRRVLTKASARCEAHWRRYRAQLLRPAPYTPQGHLSLPLGSRTNGIPVHRLVMLAFSGPCPIGMEVLHADGDPKNNALSNLRYGTRSENNLDVTRHNRRKVTVQDIRDIRQRSAHGEKGVALAQEYGVCHSQISNIINYVHYKQL